jgi:Xaa-Pro aminopeptidase
MYPHQSERLTRTLEAHGLAALVATSAENVLYVTGFRSLTHAVFETPHFAVFTPRGTALVVPGPDVAPIVADQIAVDHVGVFGGFQASFADAPPADVRRIQDLMEGRAPSPVDALAGALAALGVKDGRVGVDERRVAPAVWQRAAERLGGLTLVPAFGHFLEARRVKSPYELECLGRALGIVEEAVNAVIAELGPGATEAEASQRYQREVLARGGEPRGVVVATGPRTWIPAPEPTDRALRAGELVRFDVGAVFKGYHASLARTAVAGAPDARQERACQALQTALETAIDTVRPGVTAGQVFDAAVAAARAAGLPDYRRYHVGHAIGLEPYERPKLNGGNATPLEAGEVLRIELPYYCYGWAGPAVRDTVLVTQRGSQALNRSHHGLLVLD